MKIVDTHAHIHFPRCETDVEDIISRFKENGGTFLLNIGIDIEDSKKAIEYAEKYDFYAAVGVHPHESKNAGETFLQDLMKLAQDSKVLAIGEMGLDYYRNLSPKEVQKEIFQAQIDLATALGKPIVVHIRDAYEDAYQILKNSDLPDPPGIIHAFSADAEWALKFVKLGFFLGIGGPVTYPKNEKLRDAIKAVGIDNILTETDCPYLPPQKYRGKRNEPSYVKYVLEKIADVLQMPVDLVAEKIYKNVREVFSL
ncbi:MAG: TatD family hydrolase [Thermotogaceae bacterium]|nr:TatD family hydrolase [Thermotogaceae bacterium]